MSRADKTQTQITYDIKLDDTNTRILDIVVTVLCATRSGDATPEPIEGALSTQPHVAFFSRFRFSREGQVEAFTVPPEASKLMR